MVHQYRTAQHPCMVQKQHWAMAALIPLYGQGHLLLGRRKRSTTGAGTSHPSVRRSLLSSVFLPKTGTVIQYFCNDKPQDNALVFESRFLFLFLPSVFSALNWAVSSVHSSTPLGMSRNLTESDCAWIKHSSSRELSNPNKIKCRD